MPCAPSRPFPASRAALLAAALATAAGLILLPPSALRASTADEMRPPPRIFEGQPPLTETDIANVILSLSTMRERGYNRNDTARMTRELGLDMIRMAYATRKIIVCRFIAKHQVVDPEEITGFYGAPLAVPSPAECGLAARRKAELDDLMFAK
jgi:hypothetical protein